MLDAVLEAIVGTLKEAGVFAFRAFPEAAEKLPAAGGVSISVESYRVNSSGLSDYLGIKTAGGGTGEREVFGRRLALKLGMEVFVPFGCGGSAACEQATERLREALTKLPSGVRLLEMHCGEVNADEEAGAYRCKCRAECLAFLVAESDGETPEFTDFKLKGTVKNGNQ